MLIILLEDITDVSTHFQHKKKDKLIEKKLYRTRLAELFHSINTPYNNYFYQYLTFNEIIYESSQTGKSRIRED